MPAKIHENTRARASAVAVLYSSDITETPISQLVEQGAYPSDDFEWPEYAEQLALGVEAHCAELDKRLASTSENWALDRMPVVDRAILRLAVYEMLYVDEVPISVAINEAVELAKQFGGEDESSRFVNGVLGRIARSLDEQNDSEPDASEQAPTDIASEESSADEH